MQVKKGNDRIVVLFPALGVVVKLPITHLLYVLDSLFGIDTWRTYGRKLVWRTLIGAFEESGSVRGMLFRGLAANWMEFWLSATKRNPFLQPTYFSLFGLLNVQRYDTPCPFKDVDLCVQLCRLTDDAVWDDGHHFSNPQNFAFRKGVLRILDYGSLGQDE